MLGSALRDCDIFFGEIPPVVGFILFNLESDYPCSALDDARNHIFDAMGQASSARISYRVAWGLPFLAEQRPRHLRSLELHGDRKSVAELTDMTLACLFLAADTSCAVINQFDKLVEVARQSDSVRLSCHLAQLSPSGIGHGGFVDPVSNLQDLTPEQFDDCIFIGDEDPDYRGGSYLVLRDYVEDVEMWHDLPTAVQEQIVGRRKRDSRLLGGGLLWGGGETEVPPAAHVACVRPGRGRPGFQWRDRLYRRSLSYVAATDAGLEYGLHFISLCRNPVAQFKRIHDRHIFRRGSRYDRLISSGYVLPRSMRLLFLPASQDWRHSTCLS